MAKKGSFSKVYDKNGDYADVEAVRFDGTRTVEIQGDVTATQTWNGDSNTALTLNASIGAKKVTQDKIGDKAVGSGQMADGSVGLTQMAASAMTDTVSANNSKLVTSQGVNAAIAAATLNRGKDYGPMSVDEINAISETIPTGSTVYVESLGASDAKVINDGYSDGTMASFSVEVGEDLKYYRSPDNSLHGWYSTEANVKIKQPANYSGGIAVDSAQDASSGSAGIEFIQSFKQDTNGNMRDIVKAQVDIVDSTSSTRTNAAATPNSVKSAYDLANTANTGLANKLDKTGDGKDVTATFTEASARANIGTGEKLSVMFGKIKKWFTDLKALAFKDTVSDSDISGTISDNHIASASTWNGKADKVSGATNGNFAALDSNGNLTDSGKKASDFATAAQGTKADTAIQGVKVNGTTLTPDANKVVTVPLATTSADGAMSAADKTKLDGIEAGAEANVQSDWDETNSAVDSFIKNKPFYEKYVGSSTKYKICTFVKGSNDSSFADGIEVFYRRGNGAIHGKLLHKSTFVLYTERINDISSNSNSIKFYYATNPDDGTKWVIYAETGSYCTLRTAPLANLPKSMVNYAGFGTVVSELPEDATEIVPLWMANSSASSGTAPVKVDAYGALTAVPMDATPTASSTNLMTSGDIKTALDGKQNTLPTSGAASSTYAININGTAESFKKATGNSAGTVRYVKLYTIDTTSGDDLASGIVISYVARDANNNNKAGFIRFRSTSTTPTGYVTILNSGYIGNTATTRFGYCKNSDNKYEVWALLSIYSRITAQIIAGDSISYTVHNDVYETTRPTGFEFFTMGLNVTKADNQSAVGSTSIPTYVDIDGEIKACTDDFVHDGDVAQTYSSTSEAPISGKGVAAAIAANDLSHISQNKQWHSICVANTSSNEGWFKFATITKKNVGYESYRVIGFYYIDEQGNYSAGPIRKYQFQATVNFTGSAYHFYVGKGPASNRLRLAKIDDSTYEVQFVAFSNKSIGIFGIHDKTNASTNDVAFETGLVSGSAYASLVNAEEDLNFGSLAYRSDCDGSGNNIEATYVKKTDGVTNVEYVANQSGGGGNLNKTINGTTTSVLSFMNDSEAVAIWNDAKTAAANAS